MDTDQLPRKLAAILYADIVGYARLTGVDEEGTHRRLRTYLDLVSEAVGKYNGRVVHYAGDAVLADFGTVADALICAAVIHHDLDSENEEVSSDRKVQFRIGVNLGDVIEDRGDIYGDGVNVAARLESLAEPGGICISESVHTAVGNKLPFDYEYMGEQSVKNIAKPVKAYHARPRSDTALPLPTRLPGKRARTQRSLAFAAIVLIVVGAGVLGWSRPWQPREEPASIERMAFPLPEQPSIAVLPFTNMSGDPEQEYFADGITEDLITDLAKNSGLFVIARNSTFTYKGKSVKVAQVSEDLGVRYVLEGSVRRVQDQVRINAQLIDATTGGHLWAERYDGSLEEILALQDTVTQKIVTALLASLSVEGNTESLSPETTIPQAHDAFLRGWAHYRRNTPDDFAKAVPYFEQAVEIDPSYQRAYAALAAVYWGSRSRGYESRSNYWFAALGLSQPESLDRAQFYLQIALKDPVPLAHQVASGMLVFQGRHDEAIAEAKRAIALDHNDPAGYQALASALIYSGKSEQAADVIAKAMRLDPLHFQEYLFWSGAGQFNSERYNDAAETLVRSTQENPDDDRGLVFLASTYGHLEREQDAKSTLELLNDLRKRREKRLAESGIQLGIDAFLMGPYTLEDVNLWPFARTMERERLRAGLLMAGIPKSAPSKAESPAIVSGAVTVDARAAKALFDDGVRFVDVRGNAYDLGHVPGATHLHLKSKFTEVNLSAVVDKGKEVVIYCMGPKCLLSSKACTKAVSWAFTNVYYFRDGFPAWRAAGFPVEVP